MLLPWHMRFVGPVLAVALCMLGRTASANECNAYGVHTSTADVPLGCPLLVVLSANSGPYQPHVTTTRYDTHTGQPMMIDLTGAVVRDPDIQLMVEEYHYHACELLDDGLQPEPYAEYEVMLQGADVGDVLDAGAYYDTKVKVVAAGPCPPFAQPQLACADPIMSCADAGVGQDPVVGPNSNPRTACNAGGSAGPCVALALLAFVRRRRR